MKSVGVIVEYNPFHNGHLYHLKKTKEMFPDAVIIAIMGGNFLQRGDLSILNKWDKTKIALEYGIDIVVELPFVFATQSADFFAAASIFLLNELQTDYLVFGSETDDIEILSTLANIQLNNSEYDSLVKSYMNEGISYPSSLSKALNDLSKVEIKHPNDILGLSYIREIQKQKVNIIPYSIKRTNDFNSLELSGSIVSASAIRNGIKNNIDYQDYVPRLTNKLLKNNNISIENCFLFLKYKIISESDLSIFLGVDEGLSIRIKKYIYEVNSFEELINKIKTKRYTTTKIQRMFIHILCNFTKKEAIFFKKPEYIRILGFSNIGKIYLNKIKKEISIPLISNFSSLKNRMLDLEFRATCIYAIINNKHDLIKQEYQQIPLTSVR